MLGAGPMPSRSQAEDRRPMCATLVREADQVNFLSARRESFVTLVPCSRRLS